MNVSRRSLLLGSALGGTAGAAALLVASAGPARAFSVEEIPARSGLGLALADRCGGSGDGAEHASLAQDLRARLAADGARPGEAVSVTCPICGCPVTATAP